MKAPRWLRLRREAWGFIVGSALFIVGAVPGYLVMVGPVVDNLTFFIGSLFFTLAAFIQLNLSGRRPPRTTTNRPDRFEWWAAAIQFAGTLFFNLSTATALSASLGGTRTGWRPDAFGSVCFLVAGVLAVVATSGRDALWDPHARTWRSTWLNLLGSVAFGLAAIGAYPVPGTGAEFLAGWATVGTIAGGVCFLVAAALTRPGTPRLT